MPDTTSQFAKGHKVPISQQSSIPSKQHLEPGEAPVNDRLPTSDGGYQLYKAAGKISGKKALVTGGDSGIGRAIVMEGAVSTTVYLPEEQKDALETKMLVEVKGGKIHLLQADLRSAQTCKSVVEEALKQMGAINTLVLNHRVQVMKKSISDLSEEQWLNTFGTDIHPFLNLSKYALPHMTRGDAIISNASVNSYIGGSEFLDYTSTKGAIVAFTRALSN